MLEAIKWTAWGVAVIAATLFLTLLAHAGADAEARSKRGVIWKLLNLSVLPLGILLFSALLSADVRRVYYPPTAPEWIRVWPAFQVTTIISLYDYLPPLLLYILSVCMLVWKTRKVHAEEA